MFKLIGILLLQVAMETKASKKQRLDACYGNDIVMNCPPFIEDKDPQMEWQYKTTTGTWKRVAKLDKTDISTYLNDTHLAGRLTHHRNGSILIQSLKNEDTGLYRCVVPGTAGIRKINVVKLNITRCNAEQFDNNITRQFNKITTQEPRKIRQYTRFTTQEPGQTRQDRRSTTQEPRQTRQYTRFTTQEPNQNTTTRVETSTSTWSTIKPSIPAIQTIVTTVTTTVTTVHTQETAEEKRDDRMPIESKTACTGNMTSASGEFHSPNFPHAYPANTDCKWTITVPQDYAAIHILLEAMNLEHEKSCLNDFIAVYDELGNQVGSRICGASDSPITTLVKGRIAVIVFKSDHSVEKTGFKIVYYGTGMNHNALR
ncbi:uncharacterized protein LOC110238083 isoform X2 [Exaiptasia diaphana]|uniref:Uncharacterized protein n=1 Tax=Exaiptasia diaphana TaxID=2652724 RepID=A0A913X5V6_EXADI|nr:uncharacterized protein LOC110238083 isoform X2 [Exaiptasia diaphana]